MNLKALPESGASKAFISAYVSHDEALDRKRQSLEASLGSGFGAAAVILITITLAFWAIFYASMHYGYLTVFLG